MRPIPAHLRHHFLVALRLASLRYTNVINDTVNNNDDDDPLA